MRLTDLEPRWFTLGGWASPSKFYIGLTFLCPHCQQQRLGVHIAPVIDPDNIGPGIAFDPVGYAASHQRHVWQRSGETFDTLSLVPSVDGSGVGHWHGTIVDGEIR